MTVVAPGSIFPPTLVTPDKEETITMKDESLPKSARLVPPRGERKIPWSEVRKHDSPEDPWIVVEGRVFDVKTYVILLLRPTSTARTPTTTHPRAFPPPRPPKPPRLTPPPSSATSRTTRAAPTRSP